MYLYILRILKYLSMVYTKMPLRTPKNGVINRSSESTVYVFKIMVSHQEFRPTSSKRVYRAALAISDRGFSDFLGDRLKAAGWEIMASSEPFDPGWRDVNLTLCDRVFLDFASFGFFHPRSFKGLYPLRKISQMALIIELNDSRLVNAIFDGYPEMSVICSNADAKLLDAAIQLFSLGHFYRPDPNYPQKISDTDGLENNLFSHFLGKLTPRETSVWLGIVEGLPNKTIARDRNISEATVKMHVRNLFDKLGVRSRLEAANLFQALTSSKN
jgi:DNA-binding CsgD family transcriptional regulator